MMFHLFFVDILYKKQIVLWYNIDGDIMLDNALKLIRELTEHNYKAYIVGGFVRDYLLGRESQDIDVCTNATPKEIKEVFKDGFLPTEDYGSVIVNKYGIRFEITTFRKEFSYQDHRKPVEIQYIDDLYQDLLRRDFTINAICIDEDGEIIDFLGGRDDLGRKLIRTVGDADERFEQDALRILRAIRFATVLDFQLDEEVVKAIHKHRGLLKDLSYHRKKEELDKIFVSGRAEQGINMLLDFHLDKCLDLENLSKVENTNSLIGIWSVLHVEDIYPFSNNEKELMKDIREVMELNNYDPMTLYHYGLYVNSVAGELKGLDKKKITECYNSLVIHRRQDLDLSSEEIMDSLHKRPGEYLSDIYEAIEREVLYHRIPNEKDKLLAYIQENFASKN